MKLKGVVLVLASFLLSCGWVASAWGQSELEVVFPDVPGSVTVTTDLHIHTVFSDGSVWPDIRIREAVREGLGAISLTEHIEYQPHSDDIPHPDRNRAYEVAKEYQSKNASTQDLLLIPGTEITRQMPPGHANAVFVSDVNKIKTEEAIDAFREAKNQGAFVFWNHPHWVGQQEDGVATLSDMHRQLIDSDLLHGIEVINDLTYSDEALQIAIDQNLTIIGTSDVHGLVDWRYNLPEGNNRPLTLVLAKDRSPEAIKEALFAGRTIAWDGKELLVGREEFLVGLISASVDVVSASYGSRGTILGLEIENRSSAGLLLRNKSSYTLQTSNGIVHVPPKGKTTVEVRTVEKLDRVKLDFEVLSAVSAPGTHPTITLETAVP